MGLDRCSWPPDIQCASFVSFKFSEKKFVGYRGSKKCHVLLEYSWCYTSPGFGIMAKEKRLALTVQLKLLINIIESVPY